MLLPALFVNHNRPTDLHKDRPGDREVPIIIPRNEILRITDLLQDDERDDVNDDAEEFRHEHEGVPGPATRQCRYCHHTE